MRTPLYMEEHIVFDEQGWRQEYPGLEVEFIVNPEDRQAVQGEGDQEGEERPEVANEGRAGNEEDEWDEDVNNPEPDNAGNEESLLQDQFQNNIIEDDEARRPVRFAPAEGNRPLSLLRDEDAEYKSFPKTYCGYNPNFPANSTYSAQCKYKVRFHDRRFARVSLLFFMVSKLIVRKLSDAVNIALRKRRGQRDVNAGELIAQGGFDNTIDHLVQHDEGK